jgi:predicted nucleic acid-binding protein
VSVVLDTNILTRAAQPAHPSHHDTLNALERLRQQGDELFIVPQNLYEFWVVATRPVAANGLGLSIEEAEAELASLKTLFRFLNDSPAVYAEWETRVSRYKVSGRNAHDARIVAAMIVHGMRRLLTFNGDDFKRFPDIVILTPAQVLQQTQTN